MRKRRFSIALPAVFVGLVVALALVAVAGSGSGQQQHSQQEADGPARVAVGSRQPYGSYLADGDGRALYLFLADQGQEGSACYDRCAEAWPPLLTDGDPEATDPALDASKLGTITREDGSRQVTYAGWPLYYYAPDAGTGEIKGQDIAGFGAEWYLLDPQGKRIEASEAQARR